MIFGFSRQDGVRKLAPTSWRVFTADLDAMQLSLSTAPSTEV
jgi:hypothetical protein